MEIYKNPKISTTLVHLFLFLFLFVNTSECSTVAEILRPYILSQLVQKIVYEPFTREYTVLNQISQDYPEIVGADRVVLYLDALATADIIAKERASLLRTERKGLRLLPEDVELSLGWLCFPFQPPHKPKDRNDLKKTRFKLINGMFTDLNKRDKLRKSIKIDLVRLPKGELVRRRLNIFDILNIDYVIGEQ